MVHIRICSFFFLAHCSNYYTVCRLGKSKYLLTTWGVFICKRWNSPFYSNGQAEFVSLAEFLQQISIDFWEKYLLIFGSENSNLLFLTGSWILQKSIFQRDSGLFSSVTRWLQELRVRCLFLNNKVIYYHIWSHC